jgi:hypothetical protein
VAVSLLIENVGVGAIAIRTALIIRGRSLPAACCFQSLCSEARALEGRIMIDRKFDLPATIERLEKNVVARGVTVFARIDHAEGARLAGLVLRPTVVMIFGNAKVGTSLMLET